MNRTPRVHADIAAPRLISAVVLARGQPSRSASSSSRAILPSSRSTLASARCALTQRASPAMSGGQRRRWRGSCARARKQHASLTRVLADRVSLMAAMRVLWPRRRISPCARRSRRTNQARPRARRSCTRTPITSACASVASWRTHARCPTTRLSSGSSLSSTMLPRCTARSARRRSCRTSVCSCARWRVGSGGPRLAVRSRRCPSSRAGTWQSCAEMGLLTLLNCL
mmetsp:Transcript_14976/g.36462  ORF Transcript_14976/g.36462 Transcript_14976/m.36462 type:complete len:227 (+) Transcript_14976:298-978(+)